MHQNLPYVFDVGESGFEQRVLLASHEHPILVDFWAEWCAPCLFLAPALERLIHAYGGKLFLAKVEVDDNMRLAGHYRLRGFPTVLLFHGGRELGRFSGSHPAHWIRDWLEAHAGDLVEHPGL